MDKSGEFKLIANAKRGNMHAFEQLYELHRGAIFRTALAITNDRMLAEEILQEAFIRAYQNLARLKENTSMAPWLYRVTVNLAYDLSARQRRGINILAKLFDWFTPTKLISPEKELEEKELQAVLNEALNRLDFKQRTTLVLFYLEGFSMVEIGQIMDVPVGTVKSRLHYARSNLRKALLADSRLSGALAYEFQSA